MITNEPEEFTSLKGTIIQRRISVEAVSFSAHVDFSQNSEFIEQVGAQHVVSSDIQFFCE
jgi:cleavage and polyadenylation specificity factor subunit 3